VREGIGAGVRVIKGLQMDKQQAFFNLSNFHVTFYWLAGANEIPVPKGIVHP
jgi:hypothetical protein